jgi:hypothetical protein
MKTFEGRLSGANGCLLIDDTSAYTGKNFDTIIAQEDTVIALLSGTDSNGNAVNFLTTQNVDTVKANALILVPLGSTITAITLTSGSVICY